MNPTDTSHLSFINSRGGLSLRFARGVDEFGNEINISFLANPTGPGTERGDAANGHDEDDTTEEADSTACAGDLELEQIQVVRRREYMNDGAAQADADTGSHAVSP